MHGLTQQLWLLRIKTQMRLMKLQTSRACVLITSFIKSAIITLLSLLIVVAFSTNTSGKFNSNEAVLTSIATIIGTILALTFTLSIIPIQTFGTAWSAAIARIYKQDWKISLAYVSLAMLTIFTLLLAIKEIYAPLTGIICIAITFDILRWYYGYICQLLDSHTAINILSKKAKSIIDQYSKAATRYGINCIKTIPYEHKEMAKAQDFEAQFYQQQSYYLDSIYYFTNELSEIASKGINNSNTSLANAALMSITGIVCYYLDKRKNNLQIGTSPASLFLVQESDADKILNHAFTLIKQINQLAITENNENVCLTVSQQYCNMTLFIANLNNQTLSLAYLPFSYLRDSIKQSLTKLSIEIPFQSTEKVVRIACRLPINSPMESTFTPIIEWLGEIGLYFLIVKKPELTSEVGERILTILYYLLSQNYWKFNEALEKALNQLSLLTVFSLSIENNIAGIQLHSPLSGVYSLTRNLSIGRIFEVAASKIEPDEKNNPYHDFFQISEEICSYFRKIARECDFGNNLILLEIIESIKHIIKVLFNLFTNLEQSEKDDYDTESKIIKEIKCYLSFMPSVFDKKKIIDFHKAENACDLLTYTALILSSSSWFSDTIFTFCNQSIYSIIESYVETKQNVSEYEVITLLMFIWQLRIIAEKENLSNALKKIDENLSNKPTQLNNDTWGKCITLLEIKKKQLNENINQTHLERYFFQDSSEDILVNLLGKKYDGDSSG